VHAQGLSSRRSARDQKITSLTSAITIPLDCRKALVPSGALHKAPFKDYIEPRDIIASRHENFARGSPRPSSNTPSRRPYYGFSDVDLAKSIVDSAKRKDFTLRHPSTPW